MGVSGSIGVRIAQVCEALGMAVTGGSLTVLFICVGFTPMQCQ